MRNPVLGPITNFYTRAVRREMTLPFLFEPKMKKILSFLIILLATGVAASAQQWSVGTNLLGYANMGTLNLEASAAVARHLTVVGSAQFNPWTFNKGLENQKQNRSQSYGLGVRWWPWYVYSGWWMSFKGKYEEYNRGGWKSPVTEEGDAWGASLGLGYTLMLKDYLNLEFGAGLWGGRKSFTRYACPSCGRITEQGNGWFIMPSDVMVSIVFIF